MRRRVWAIVDTLALSREAAIARYGQPRIIRSDTVTNYQRGTLDSVMYLRFPTFEANYYRHADGRGALRSIQMALHQGISRDSLVALWGPPDADEDFQGGRLLLYEIVLGSEGNVLNIYLVAGRVRWVAWIFEPERAL